MRLAVSHRCRDFNSYRAARVKSLFNCESGAEFDLTAELPIDDDGWRIGYIVGPSGSGKSSLLGGLWPDVPVFDPAWPAAEPIVDAVAPGGDFNQVTGAFAAVGLGTVQAWLRPFNALSTGEKFRANLARLLCEQGGGQGGRAKLDEFTSVVDRQIARVGAMAFGKAWRRGGGQIVLAGCHYDVIDWLEPCWTFDTATGRYAGRGLWRRPSFELEIRQARWGEAWPAFEPHHYLKAPAMVAPTNYVGWVGGEAVVHVAFAPRPGLTSCRACRLVVMPEWQGAGVGLRFLNHLCRRWARGLNPYKRRMPTYFHTSHPGLCAALRRDSRRWVQVSAALYGSNKARSGRSIAASAERHPERWGSKRSSKGGFGGHFRAVQGFKFCGS